VSGLQSQSKEISAALKKAKAVLRRQKKLETRLVQGAESLGVGVLALSAPEQECLTQYCLDTADSAHAGEHLRNRIVDRFLSASTTDLVCLLRPSSFQEVSSYRHAAQYFINWQVKTWIAKINADKGIAPNGKDTIMYRLKVMRQEATRSGVDIAPAAKQWGQYSWLRKFQKRWSVKQGRPSTRDLEPLTVRRQKVSSPRKTPS